MIIKKSDRIVHKNSDKCTAYEYHFSDKALNAAYIEINGRYPDSGETLNRDCKEIIHVISGTGKVVVEGKEYAMEEQDQVFVPNGNKFHFEDCVNLKILVPCSPAWNLEQYKHFD